MARLDRLAPVKELAQLGATLGREFSYEVLRAVSPLDESSLQQGLRQLVQAELLYQRGLPPQATYLFKHALIQDTADQSLLKSKRQQLHQEVAQALVEKFSQTIETQPELAAHHYTEAGLIAHAIPYWQRAGQKAAQRSANVEAISHLTKGLSMLKTLPDTPERAQQELMLQIALGVPLGASKGLGASEIEQTYSRALELCRQMGETSQLFPVLRGLQAFYLLRAEYKTSGALSEQLLTIAQEEQDLVLRMAAHFTLGQTRYMLGQFTSAREHMEQAIALYDPSCTAPQWIGIPPEVQSLGFEAHLLWYLGYPDQALTRSQEALTRARRLSHPYTVAVALWLVAVVPLFRREWQVVHEWATAAMTLSTEQGFPFWLAGASMYQGRVLAEQEGSEQGVAQIRQGLAAWQATGTESMRPFYLALLAEACGKAGQIEEGLGVLAEALVIVDKNEERYYEAEIYRLKGELTLHQEKQKAKGKEQK